MTAPALPDAGLALKIRLFGLTAAERGMVDMVVRLSQRRTPTLQLVRDGEDVDVYLVDGRDPVAMSMLYAADPLAKKPVLLIDGEARRTGQQAVSRPVQWSLLPMIIARTMDGAHEAPAAQVADVARAAATAPAVPLRPQPTQVAVAPAGGASDVLVVDDSLAVRNFMQATLRPFNLRVSFAESGEQALELVRRQSFMCIFLDVVMPGIDGYQVCRSIKNAQQGAGAPSVVMLTSKNSPFDKIRGKMAGCDAYLTKPVVEAELLRLLARFVPDGVPRSAAAGG